MSGDFAMIHTADQWIRSAFENASMEAETGAVQLAWETSDVEASKAPPPAGLAFDPWCRLYRSIPEEGRVVRMRWGNSGPESGTERDLFEDVSSQHGEFIREKEGTGPLDKPVALAADNYGRLFVSESAAGRILVFDLLEKRPLRRVRLGRPLRDLVCRNGKVYALLGDPPGLAVLDARSGPYLRSIPPTLAGPSRMAVSPGGCLWVLERGGEEDASIVPLDRPEEALPVSFATDLAFADNDILVVARTPGQDFLRFRVGPGERFELPRLHARHYDGRGIVRMPEGGIGFWTEKGFSRTTLLRMRYIKEGRVIGFRLDSGRFQTIWGRMFIDACIPRGCSVKVRCLALDEEPEGVEKVAWTPPMNAEKVTIPRPDLSPPLPPKSMMEAVFESQSLYRRETGPEIQWRCAGSETGYATYEAQTIAQPGRYLWVVLELKGTTGSTPKVGSLRVEYPSHDLMRRLPRVFSRDEASADFLRRYLAIMEGAMREIDLRAVCRHVLLDPHATPEEALPWLASFVGMALDERWPVCARRTLIANGVWLFRFRGTVGGLKRFIEIYLDRPVVILEHFKVRGLGGAIVGEGDSLVSRSVVGGGFRVGGAVGDDESVSVSEENIEDAFETHAHRFSVVIPLSLDREKLEVVEHILAVHRPCHTMYDICSVDAGMRAGIGLYVGLTSLVGRTSGFGDLRLGGSLLGRQDIVGRPLPGVRVGSGAVGKDVRVG